MLMDRTAAENTGIISNAIANANAEKIPAHEGQENVSLLQQQQAPKTSPASGQFTFTCDSQVPGNLTWPGSDPKPSTTPLHQQGQVQSGQRPQARVGRSDQPGVHSTMAGAAASGAGASTLDGTANGGGTAPKQAQKKKKTRGKLSKQLEEQARERQREQELRNYQNPPKDGDIYICPFCEFEGINGYKPKYLIRAFELKERKKRLEDERRQRLLEKAKARARKGKKGKLPAKNHNFSENQTQSSGDAPPMNPNPSEDTRSEDYDDYGDEGEEFAGGEEDVGGEPPTQRARPEPPPVAVPVGVGTSGGADQGLQAVA
jgi:hypothetical protein